MSILLFDFKFFPENIIYASTIRNSCKEIENEESGDKFWLMCTIHIIMSSSICNFKISSLHSRGIHRNNTKSLQRGQGSGKWKTLYLNSCVDRLPPTALNVVNKFGYVMSVWCNAKKPLTEN